MKVLLATGLYPPEIGGPATYAVLIEQQLPKRGIAVSVLPFQTVRQYPKVFRHVLYAYKLWRMSRGVDVVYALDSISVGLPAIFVAWLSRKPFLLRLGGDYAWEQGRMRYGLTETLDEYLRQKTSRPFMVRILAYAQTFVATRAVRVIAPSQYLKEVFASWGVTEEKITVVYSALHPLSVPQSKELCRQSTAYTYPTIVSAGRLVPWKGFKTLIRIVATLKTEYPAITLVIAGDGEELDSLKEEAQKCGVVDAVRFIGRTNKDKLGVQIKAADMFVLNTAYEGLSHQLIEVMDIGTPIVTTVAGGNRELIADGVHGFLTEFNDEVAMAGAIRKILEYGDTRTRIIENARVRSKDFSEEKLITGIEVVLKDIYESTHA